LPFYQEWHQNDAIANWSSRVYTGITESHSGFANVDLCRLITYRTRPRKGNAIAVIELPKEKADPYTIFVDQNRVKRDAAIKRGFSSDLFTEDRGHPFEMLRFKSEGSLWSGSFWEPFSYRDDYRGANLDIASYLSTADFVSGFAPIGWSDLAAYAQSTYAKAAPTPTVFDLGQFLGELREGLPRLGLDLLTKSKTFKAIGSDYLNVEFGWKPFISDLQATGEALMGATTALLGPRGPLHRLRREDPSDTMRSFDYGSKGFNPSPWPDQKSTAENAAESSEFYKLMTGKQWSNAVGIGTGHAHLSGNMLFSERTTSERWFEGSFSFIPKIGFNPDSYFDRLGQLVKTDITPSTLWELAPWSWLTDWFLKIGNTIAANEVASDNRIVSNYAYAMEHREIVRGTLITGITGPNYAGPTNIARRWTTTGKRRLRANPYGFKPMTTANLNTNQWLIMAALGLTSAGR